MKDLISLRLEVVAYFVRSSTQYRGPHFPEAYGGKHPGVRSGYFRIQDVEDMALVQRGKHGHRATATAFLVCEEQSCAWRQGTGGLAFKNKSLHGLGVGAFLRGFVNQMTLRPRTIQNALCDLTYETF